MISRVSYKIKDAEAADAVRLIVWKKHMTLKELSHVLGKNNPNFMSLLLFTRRKNGTRIQRGELDRLAEILAGSKDGLDEYFTKVCSHIGRPRKEDVVSQKPAQEKPDDENHKARLRNKYGIFKSGNGFRYVFSLDGKDRTVFGMTHNECYKKAKELTEKHEAPKTEPPVTDGQITMRFSDTDAVILSERLFKLLRESKTSMTQDEYEAIRSIYCRLNIQLV